MQVYLFSLFISVGFLASGCAKPKNHGKSPVEAKRVASAGDATATLPWKASLTGSPSEGEESQDTVNLATHDLVVYLDYTPEPGRTGAAVMPICVGEFGDDVQLGVLQCESGETVPIMAAHVRQVCRTKEAVKPALTGIGECDAGTAIHYAFEPNLMFTAEEKSAD